MKNKKFTFFAAVFGNILEYYDFTVYSVFVITIGKVFFPPASQVTQVLYTLAVFAVGFVTRPLGSVFFGYIGDNFGRKKALILSMTGMATSTFIVGILPGYHSIGYMSTIILVIARLLQGLCISGEGAGTAIFILEHYHKKSPGFVTSLTHSTNILGTLIAILLGVYIKESYPGVNDVWRYAFILGGILGIIGILFRIKLSETPIFIDLQNKRRKKQLLINVIRTSKKYMIITFFTGAVTSSIVYLVKTYVNVFFCNVLGCAESLSLRFLLYSNIILMLFMPLFGWLSDIYGKKRTIILSNVFIILLILPVMYLMGMEGLFLRIAALTILGILAASISGVSYIFIISLFSPEQRFSGVAFSFNTGIAIFGGTSPFISRLIVDITGWHYSPGIYIIFVAMIFLLVMYLNRNSIDEKISS